MNSSDEPEIIAEAARLLCLDATDVRLEKSQPDFYANFAETKYRIVARMIHSPAMRFPDWGTVASNRYGYLQALGELRDKVGRLKKEGVGA